MARVPKIIPSLTGGVSQQPASLRFPGQLEACENSRLSLVDGAAKRPPTNHVAELIASLPDHNAYHLIEKDGIDYVVTLSNQGPSVGLPGVRVFDLEGNEYLVTDPDLGGADQVLTHYFGDSPNNYVGDWRHIGQGGTWTTSSADEAGSTVTAEVGPLGTDTAVELWDVHAVGSTGVWTHQTGAVKGRASLTASVYVKAQDEMTSITLQLRNTTKSSTHQAVFTWTAGVPQATALPAGMPGISGVETIGGGWYRIYYTITEDPPGFAGTVDVGDEYSYVQLTLVGTAAEEKDYFWGLQVTHKDDEDDAVPVPVEEQFGPFRWLTVADATFLLNTAWKTRAAAPTSPTRDEWIGGLGIGATDIMYLAVNQWVATTDYNYTIENGTAAYSGTVTSLGSAEDTTDIATSLATAISLHAGLTATASGSVVEIVSTSAVIDFSVSDGGADVLLTAFRDEVEVITELPLTMRHEYRVKISPDPSTDLEDYFVQFEADGDNPPTGAGSLPVKGHWKEATDWDTVTGLDPNSMPHQLSLAVDDENGTITGTAYKVYFTFGSSAWVDREVGSEVTNPNPTFVGRKLNDLMFHSNRFGWPSGVNCFLSEAGVYFNVWRTTTTVVPDSDPIDIATNETRLSDLLSAEALDEQLVLSSARGQFVLEGSPLSPATALLVRVSSYRVDALRPFPMGRSLVYTTTGVDYAGTLDLFRNQEGVFSHEETSQAVPKYIPAPILFGAALSREGYLFLQSDELFTYKVAWNGEQRIQSAWSKWTFGPNATVRHVDFVDGTGVLLIERDGALFLETVDVEDGLVDPGQSLVVHLDRRLRDTAVSSETYDAGNDKTTITLPYDLDTGLTADGVAVATTAGVEIPVVSIGIDTVVVYGDVTGTDYWVGERYAQSLTLSEPVPQRDGPTGPIRRSGRYTLATLDLQVADTGAFQVDISYGGQTFTREFTAQVIGGVGIGAGEVDLYTGIRTVGVFTPAIGTSVTLTNNTVLPSRFIGLVWNGDLARFNL